jgi:hypothetical protein
MTTTDDQLRRSRSTLQLVATHVVARARQQANGRFGLRVTPGGFGTPEFGDDLRRVRVSGGALVVESGSAEGAWSRATMIDGSTLEDLARFAEVDLSAELSVGHDTPLLGDVRAPLTLDTSATTMFTRWFDATARALDEIVAGAPAIARPSLVQLWSEHFDVALDLAATPERRVNLGGSPGDEFHDRPYLYVGPWTTDRPGNPDFWNAPFGAVLAADTIDGEDHVAAAVEFFRTGLEMLGS